MKEKITVIAFDADDTLWDCQGHFDRVMHSLYRLLLPWTGTEEKAAEELFSTERKNMPLMGYGTKAFTLSMLETAMRVSHGEMSMNTLAELQQECYRLLDLPATPLPGVEETLRKLKGHFRMVLFTKGELLDQENKLKRSGLADFFSRVVITSDKTEKEFRYLCHSIDADPDELLMVGNSMKSDIAPALAIGAWAVHVPFHVTWELEHAPQMEHSRLRCIDEFSQLTDLLLD